MRQFATGLNRSWLALVGLLLLLSGLASAAIGTGVGARTSIGPRSSSHLLGGWATTFFSHVAAIVGLGVVAFVVAAMGVAWLLAQVPRTNAAAPFRLQDDAVLGLTTCTPSVLTDAVSADVQTLPGVTGAAAVLRGTAAEPELTLRVTAGAGTDVQALIQDVQSGPVANLHRAMGVPLHRLDVQVDITRERRAAESVTL